MTQNLHMSGIIMYAGLTARMVVPELCGMIPVLWQSPFHFTDEIWLWWYGVGVILTLTKRGLSQPPEAFGEEGVCNCREGVCEQVRGFIGWKIWVDASTITRRNVEGETMMQRGRACMSAQALLSMLVSSDAPCEHSTYCNWYSGTAQWLVMKLCWTMQLPGVVCLTVLEKEHFCLLET